MISAPLSQELNASIQSIENNQTVPSLEIPENLQEKAYDDPIHSDQNESKPVKGDEFDEKNEPGFLKRFKDLIPGKKTP